jgi:hypothetical protein
MRTHSISAAAIIVKAGISSNSAWLPLNYRTNGKYTLTDGEKFGVNGSDQYTQNYWNLYPSNLELSKSWAAGLKALPGVSGMPESGMGSIHGLMDSGYCNFLPPTLIFFHEETSWQRSHWRPKFPSCTSSLLWQLPQTVVRTTFLSMAC